MKSGVAMGPIARVRVRVSVRVKGEKENVWE
jgi:hypothetical protein